MGLLLGPNRARSTPTLTVIRPRIARTGQDRSKGYRTIILSGAELFLDEPGHSSCTGSPKAGEQFKEAAKHVLGLTEQLAELLKRRDFMEVKSE